MAYQPFNRVEVMRRWSILRQLHYGFFKNDASYSFSPWERDKSNYWTWFSPLLRVTPMFFCQRMRGQRSPNDRMSGLARVVQYQLVIKWTDTQVSGDKIPGDYYLDGLVEELPAFFDGAKVPFYEIDFVQAERRVPDLDFMLTYVRDAMRTETIDREKNVLVLDFSASF